jgi:hypothetical protein
MTRRICMVYLYLARSAICQITEAVLYSYTHCSYRASGSDFEVEIRARPRPHRHPRPVPSEFTFSNVSYDVDSGPSCASRSVRADRDPSRASRDHLRWVAERVVCWIRRLASILTLCACARGSVR